VITTIELDIELGGTIVPPVPEIPPSLDHDGGEPEEPGFVDDFTVTLTNANGVKTDITHLLTPDQIEDLEAEYYQEKIGDE
jgi:hypothetical protein